MTDRLSRIVTRSGDKGSTGLADGSRISKNSPRIQAIGDIDELNSAIGMLLCENLPEQAREEMLQIQHDLFDIGGELSIPGRAFIADDQIVRLESILETYNADLPPLREFVLPGGSRAGAASHLCRSICRRAERSIARLGEQEVLSDYLLKYVNRLSDLLFVLARVLNRHDGHRDKLWNNSRK